MNRLEARKYVLTVEGATEKLYFEWLQCQINACPHRAYNVSIDAKIQKSPAKFYKNANVRATPQVAHICDIESVELIDNFKRVLSEMNDARKQKGISYILGYSNFTFELWIILHKLDCYAPLSHRKNYLDFIRRSFNEKFESLNEYKQEDNFKKCLHKLTIEDVRLAICRAEKIMKMNTDNKKTLNKVSGYSFYCDNPALSVHEIVKKILVECGVINN